MKAQRREGQESGVGVREVSIESNYLRQFKKVNLQYDNLH